MKRYTLIMNLPNGTPYRYDVIAGSETEAIERAKAMTGNEFKKVLSNSTNTKIINR